MKLTSVKCIHQSSSNKSPIILISPLYPSPPMQVLILLAVFMLSACQSTPKHQIPDHAEITFPLNESSAKQPDPLLTKLYQQHQEWHGTPYRWGGNNRTGIDCSGFVQVTYRDIVGIDLPRTTTQQYRSGAHVNQAELQTGDLVFFRHGRHVGIYLENHKFLHASTSRGVMISDIKSPYWTRHYWRSISVMPKNRPPRN